MQIDSKIFIAGHNGMVGSSILKKLSKRGFSNLITANRSSLDLTNQSEVSDFFSTTKPEVVFLAAAKVGGIYANNNNPADFIYDNLMIQSNVIHQAFKNDVKKLLFLGSSCIYPKLTKQPMHEESLLAGKLEPTNEPYAIAKIAGIKLCESYNRQYGKTHNLDYRSVMPTNLYGPGDTYDDLNSHVIPSLIQRFHNAKKNKKSFVQVWGNSSTRREFLYVDDMADACIFIMNLDKNIYDEYTQPMNSHINLGFGTDITIGELSKIIKRIVKFDGDIIFDEEKLIGTPQKLMNSSRLNSLGWTPHTNIEEGISKTYKSFKKETNNK